MTPQAVLIVGAGGQLGAAAATLFGGQSNVLAVTRRELDVTDAAAVTTLVTSMRPNVIINGSAYTNVDGAEDEPVQALAINAIAVKTLARAAASVGATLVHYSTDFVFDGRASQPYDETDAPNPRGTYAMSKLLGEWLAAETPKHYVLRVESLFGGARAKSSIDRILDSLRAGVTVRAFADRALTPSYVPDVLLATTRLLEMNAPYGLYHCVNSGVTDWAALSHELARLVGRPDAPIEHVRMAETKMRVERPLYAALSNRKLSDAGVSMPDWQSALARYVRDGRQ